MITYLKGILTYKTPTFVVVEVNGVGYHVNISLNTYSQIEKLETVKILTTPIIREDSQTLYGFAEEAERALFLQLISVSGVGPSTAQLVLSAMTPEEIRSSIISENEAALGRVKGIGPKTAKRIILDLKDKLIKDGGEVTTLTIAPQNNTMRDEALSALVALGFNRIEVQKALNKLLKEQPATSNVEALIKLTLKQLS